MAEQIQQPDTFAELFIAKAKKLSQRYPAQEDFWFNVKIGNEIFATTEKTQIVVSVRETCFIMTAYDPKDLNTPIFTRNYPRGD